MTVASTGRLRVLGVDPGSLKLGWGIVERCEATRRITHIDNGVIVMPAGAELPTRIVELSRGLHRVLESFRPSVAAVEDVFVDKGVRSALTLGQARGAALATIGLCGVPVSSYSTTRVKARVAGTGRAAKEQVAEMVTRLLGLAEHPFEDAADALAVALCHALSEGALVLPSTAAGGKSLPQGRKGRRAGLAALARAQGKL